MSTNFEKAVTTLVGDMITAAGRESDAWATEEFTYMVQGVAYGRKFFEECWENHGCIRGINYVVCDWLQVDVIFFTDKDVWDRFLTRHYTQP